MRRRTAAIVVGAIGVATVALAATAALDSRRSVITVVSGNETKVAPPPFARSPVTAPVAPVAGPTTAVSQQVIADGFNAPWAMAFLPDGRVLVTEKSGTLRLVTPGGAVSAAIANVPAVSFTRQGGLLDVAIDPDYAVNHYVWLSYAEPGDPGATLAVARATLALGSGNSASLQDVRVIWRQTPRVQRETQFGGRMAFAPDGRLFVSAGDHKEEPLVQSLETTIGKIIRIERDGSIPLDNPYVGRRRAKPEIWTIGHRNPYGLVFATDGQLYESEMGPDGGDEFNLIRRQNYGWPAVSEGNHYADEGGAPYPRHATDTRFAPPLVSWTPVIAPGGMIQYTGTLFRGWNGDFVLAGLAGRAIVRVRVNNSGRRASELGRIALPMRVREVEQAPDGSIWILEDASTGRLIRLTPAPRA